MGAPRASTVNAMGRRSAGKQSDKIEEEGGSPPASPTPTPIRPSRNCKYVSDRPQNTVKADQITRAAARMLRRFERSASHEIGKPKVT